MLTLLIVPDFWFILIFVQVWFECFHWFSSYWWCLIFKCFQRWLYGVILRYSSILILESGCSWWIVSYHEVRICNWASLFMLFRSPNIIITSLIRFLVTHLWMIYDCPTFCNDAPLAIRRVSVIVLHRRLDVHDPVFRWIFCYKYILLEIHA